jgi:hypothetical protein
LKPSLAGGARKVKISRSANVRGTIGSRSRSRSQPQYTCRYAERGTVLCVMSRLPLFDISPFFTPSISPTNTRDPIPKGPLRPLAGGGRSRRSHAGRLAAVDGLERSTDPVMGPGAGFGSNAAYDEQAERTATRKSQDRHASLTNRIGGSGMSEHLDPTPRPGGCRLEPTLNARTLQSSHTRHIYMCTMHNPRCGTCPSPGIGSAIMSTIASAAQKCAAGCARHR